MLGHSGESIYTAAYRINVINQSLSSPLKDSARGAGEELKMV